MMRSAESSHRRSRRNTKVYPNYLSESEVDLHHHHGGWHRSRSSPPIGRRTFQNNHNHNHRPTKESWLRRSSNDLDFGVFSAHDLHAANEKRASRRDLAELRNQLFARSTNDLRGGGRGLLSGDRRASGRELLTHWAANNNQHQSCQKCNENNLRHTLSHHNLPSYTDYETGSPQRLFR